MSLSITQTHTHTHKDRNCDLETESAQWAKLVKLTRDPKSPILSIFLSPIFSLVLFVEAGCAQLEGIDGWTQAPHTALYILYIIIYYIIVFFVVVKIVINDISVDSTGELDLPSSFTITVLFGNVHICSMMYDISVQN